jgi:hypothetical protein
VERSTDAFLSALFETLETAAGRLRYQAGVHQSPAPHVSATVGAHSAQVGSNKVIRSACARWTHEGKAIAIVKVNFENLRVPAQLDRLAGNSRTGAGARHVPTQRHCSTPTANSAGWLIKRFISGGTLALELMHGVRSFPLQARTLAGSGIAANPLAIAKI